MNYWKCRFTLESVMGNFEEVICASTQFDVKNIIERKYNSKIRTLMTDLCDKDGNKLM